MGDQGSGQSGLGAFQPDAAVAGLETVRRSARQPVGRGDELLRLPVDVPADRADRGGDRRVAERRARSSDLKTAIKTNLPGIGDQIDLDSLISNAGTIGLISGASLLLTGLGWIDSLRASIRSMHELDDQPGNFVKLKIVDLGALIGLGVIGLIATGASSILVGLSEKIVELDRPRRHLAGALGNRPDQHRRRDRAPGAVLFLYLQTAMPRIMLPRKVALIAAVAGGIVFYAGPAARQQLREERDRQQRGVRDPGAAARAAGVDLPDDQSDHADRRLDEGSHPRPPLAHRRSRRSSPSRHALRCRSPQYAAPRDRTFPRRLPTGPTRQEVQGRSPSPPARPTPSQ